jgi:DMSO/TMAO reductase YedYZ molybdopterin-dependent catalytic subunit
MKTARLFAICAILQVAAWAQQSGATVLEITGDVPHPHTYQEQEWKQLKHTSITATNAHEKKTATYSGVPLRDLLKDAGVPMGENLRGKALTICVVVTASDGYQVTFSIAELDEGIGNVQALVADSEDSKPLAQTVGPLRLVVPADKRPARWVRMVKTIRVVASPSAASPQ